MYANPNPEVTKEALAAETGTEVPTEKQKLAWMQEEIDWRERQNISEEELRANIRKAKANPVYLAEGPIIRAILLANLITGVVAVIVYEFLK